MHLETAEDIRTHVENGTNGRLRRLLQQEWPAFYMGSIAADFQSICGRPRIETHFYKIPPSPEDKAYPLMWANYPQVADASRLPDDHAVFIAAYSVHLMLDLVWFRQILIPYFVEASEWGDFSRRHLVHHILLSYLDKLAFDSLPGTAADILASAQPRQWLPFATDAVLRDWRDMLVAQMMPGIPLKTVEIYANRLRMSPDEFGRKLQDSLWIEEQVFSNIPIEEVQEILKNAAIKGIALITDYLQI